MGQLQLKNPQMAGQINQAMNNGIDPQTLIKQMMNSMNNNQIKNALNQARQFGVPNNILQQIQNTK